MRATLSLVLGTTLAVVLSGCVCCNQRACCDARIVSVRDVAPEPALPDGPYAKDAKQTAWDYLRAKYDADGDASISAEEYGRGEKAFANLDKDGDGKITQGDMKPGPVHALMVRMTLAHWFQGSGDPMSLERVELEAALAFADGNGDGTLTSAELAKYMAGTPSLAPGFPKPPPGMDPHVSLLLMMDADENRVLATDEVLAWFDHRAKDGFLSLIPRRRPGGRGPRPIDPTKLAREGAEAPDFTLTSPDGKTTVTLSDFKDTRPVALIFGSYT